MPRFRAFRKTKQEILERERRRLRIDEYAPKILSSFVRNRLIDEVYLPIVGDNLAKQLGAAGDSKRTDQSGLLLLVSPPGYGKTTLMEYVANKLGLIFMKVNGPALGHRERRGLASGAENAEPVAALAEQPACVADPAPDIDGAPGSTRAGTGMSGFVFPRSVSGSRAANFTTPGMFWVWDRRPPRTCALC